MCSDCCSGGAELLCPTCREKTEQGAFPFTRADFSFNQLFAYAVDTFKRDWLMLCLVVVIFFAIAGLATGVTSALNQLVLALFGGGLDSETSRENLPALFGALALGTSAGMLFNMVVQGFVMLGLYRVLIDVLDGKKTDLARIFSQGRKLGRYVVLNIFLMLITYVPIVLFFGFIAGGVLVSAGLSLHELSIDAMRDAMGPAIALGILLATIVLAVFAVWIYPLWIFGVPELVVSEASALEALQRAWQLGAGLRLTALGFGFVVGLLMLAGAALCCVGLIPAMAIGSLLNLSLFLAARTDPAFPPRDSRE